jgi:hypothetical protein
LLHQTNICLAAETKPGEGGSLIPQ